MAALINEIQRSLDSLDLGLPPVKGVELVHRRPGHIVYRISAGKGSYILKQFSDPDSALEPQIYEQLNKFGVPTLPVYGRSSRAILLEDLDSSPDWRLAIDSDMSRTEVGAAVADWYARLHWAGFKVVNDPDLKPEDLNPWVTMITDQSLDDAGKKLGIADSKGWKAACQNAGILRSAILDFPQTFNYNDFALENLALTHGNREHLRAVLFDYNQFSTGPVYSDWRNVTLGLSGATRCGFIEAFGPVSQEERILDDVLSTLHGLVVASRRENSPRWAFPLLKEVRNGRLERKVQRALEHL